MGDQGDEWEFERIGTEREKLQVEKELQELRERLAQVDEWKKRRDDIEQELAAVWTDKGVSLEAPDYVDVAGEQQEKSEERGDDVGGEEELVSAGTEAADEHEEAAEDVMEKAEEAEEVAEEAEETEEDEEEAEVEAEVEEDEEAEEINAAVSSTAEDSDGHREAST